MATRSMLALGLAWGLTAAGLRAGVTNQLILTETPPGEGFLTGNGTNGLPVAGESAGDTWWFNAATGDRISARVEMSTTGSYTYIRLVNQAGSSITYSYGYYNGRAELQNIAIPSPGVYAVRVWADYTTPAYRLRLDIGRPRQMEDEDNGSTGSADLLALTTSITGAFQGRVAGTLPFEDTSGDFFDLGHLDPGNGITVNLLFPAGSALDASRMTVTVHAAGSGALFATNGAAAFTYDAVTNRVHYLQITATNRGLFGQYLLNLSGIDSRPPLVTGCTLPAEGTTNSAVVDRFDLYLSEFMTAATVTNPANYRLRGWGADNLPDTADDEAYTVTATYAGGTAAVFRIPDGPLQPSRTYRLAVSNLADRFGTAMTGGYHRTFRMTGVTPFVLENRTNNTSVRATTLSPAPTGQPAGTFVAINTYGGYYNPHHLATADFNADGHTDLAVANNYGNNVGLLMGLGDGSFTARTAVAVASRPIGLQAGRFNADTNTDLAVAQYDGAAVMILLGDGAGGFTTGAVCSVGANPFRFAGGDFNGDGFADLAVSCMGPDAVGVLLGRGDGTFHGVTNYAVGADPHGMAAADLQGDGRLDLLVASYGSDVIGVLLGQTGGTFGARTDYAAGDGPVGIAARDLDGDNKIDVVAGIYNADELRVFRGLGDGTLALTQTIAGLDAPYDLLAQDLDGDAKADIAVAAYGGDYLYVYRGRGDATFTNAGAYYLNYDPITPVADDFNHDGRQDLAVAVYNNSYVSVFLGAGTEPLAQDLADPAVQAGFGRGNLHNSSDVDYWSFQGEAGDAVSYAIDEPGSPYGAGLALTLYRPDGQSMGAIYGNYSGGYAQSGPVILPLSGRYTLSVSVNYDYQGEYRISAFLGKPPTRMETEDNDSTSQANTLSLTLTNGQRQSVVAGLITVEDSAGDYFALGNLASGAVVQVQADLPSWSTLAPLLEVLDGAGRILPALTTNRAVRLDGSGDHVNLGAWAPSNTWTVEAWVQPTSLPSGRRGIAGSAADYRDWGVVMTDGRLGANVRVPGGGVIFMTGTTARTWQWDHVAVACSGTNAILYINGIAMVTNVSDPFYAPTASGARIGMTYCCGEYFPGLIDEVRVWNVARTGADIRGAMSNRLTGAETGLAGYWNFDQGTAADRGPFARHGTLNDNAYVAGADLWTQHAATNVTLTVPSNGLYYVWIAARENPLGLQSQYRLKITLADASAPSVTACSLPAPSSVSSGVWDRFTVTFSEEMDAVTVTNGANYSLRGAGGDNLFGTADDAVYTVGISYSAGLVATLRITNGPLQAGLVRFVASTGIVDTFGTPLGSAFVRDFAVALVPGFFVESRTNDSPARATSLSPSPSGLPAGSFVAQGNYSGFNYPHHLVTADFNADGHADLAAANYNGNNVMLLLGLGDGAFTSRPPVAVASGPIGLYAGRINADSNLDLAVAQHNNSAVMILLGDGAGGFTTGSVCGVGANPFRFAGGDFNGDGFADLAISCIGPDVVGVLLGRGDGTFHSVTNYAVGADPYGVAAADLQGDGRLDLIVANHSGDTISVLPGQPGGTFGARTDYAAGDGPVGIAARDLDGDGQVDVVVGVHIGDQLRIFRGLGDGSLTLTQTISGIDGAYDLLAQDLDGDAKADIAVAAYGADYLYVYRGRGDATFTNAGAYYLNYDPITPVADDFNHDGRPDLAVAVLGYSYVAVFLGAGREPLAQDLTDPAMQSGFGRGNLHTSADVDYWSFQGEAGDTMLYAIDEPGSPYGAGLALTLYRPDGQSMGAIYGNYSGGYAQSGPVTLPYSGRYMLSVSVNYDYQGEYRIGIFVAKPPTKMETEDNNSTGAANLMTWALAAGRQTAAVGGMLPVNDTSGDYFSLGTLSSGTVVEVKLQAPAGSSQGAAVSVFGPNGWPLPHGTNNRALRVDGSGDGVSLGAWAPPTNTWTVQAWAQPWGWSGRREIAGAMSQGRDWAAAMQDNRYGNIHANNEQALSDQAAVVGPWTHLAAVADGTNMRLYVQGVLATSKTAGVYVPTASGAYIGRSTSGDYFLGLIDEVSIWNRALTGGEIAAGLTQSLTGAESGIMGYWNFDNNTAQDLSPAARHGTLQGDATIVGADLWSTNGPATFSVVAPSSGVYYARVMAPVTSLAVQTRYALSLALVDTSIPMIQSTTLPPEGTSTNRIVNTFSSTFSEEMDAVSVRQASNYVLRGSGPDGVLQNGDDDIYGLSVSYSSGTAASFIITNGPLQTGMHAFVAGSGIVDRSGTPLSVYTQRFTIATLNGYLTERRSNDSAATGTRWFPTASNAPSGSFRSSAAYSLGAYPRRLVTGYFNEDSRLDLALTDESDYLRIYHGDGAGGLTLITNMYLGSTPMGMVTGNWNGDVSTDLAVCRWNGNSVLILTGRPGGLFAAGPSLATGSQPADLVSGDWNGDGLADLATPNYYGPSVSLFLGTGTGTFTSAGTVVVGSYPYDIACADFNDDGDPDLITANNLSGGLATVLLGGSNATFTVATNLAAGTYPRAIVAGDFNFDGKADAAVANENSDNVTVWVGRGDGTFETGTTYAVGDRPYTIAIGDANGDAIPDLIVPSFYDDRVSVLPGDGFGRFGAAIVSYGGDAPVDAIPGDFNGDGWLDVATASYYDQQVRILLGQPRDVWSEALPGIGIRLGFGRGALLDTSDYDWWPFYGEAGDWITAAIDIPGNPSGCALDVTIFRPEGPSLTGGSISYYGYGETYLAQLPVSGWYAVRVGYNYDYRGEYRLSLMQARPPMQAESEGNDDRNNSDTLTWALAGGAKTASVLGYLPQDDTSGDWYRLGGLSDGVSIRLDVSQTARSTVSSVLEILNSTGVVASAAPGAGTLTWTTTQTENYYARIRTAAGTYGLEAIYVLALQISDSVPPAIVGDTLPAEGSTSTVIATGFQLRFSEDLNPATVTNPANYEVRLAGADDLFDTGDDALQPLLPAAYSGGRTATYDFVLSPLQPGRYRVTADQALADPFGQTLVQDYVRTFRVADLPGYVVEGVSNNTAGTAKALTMPDGPGWSAGGGRGLVSASSDTDFFSFPALAGDKVVLAVYEPGGGWYSRLNAALVAGGGAVLINLVHAYNVAEGQTAPVTIPSNGTYYVRMTEYDGYRGEYQFNVLVVRAPRQPEAEENGNIPSATALSLAVNGSTSSARAAGFCLTAADSDYFDLGVVTQSLSILVSARATSNSAVRPVVGVYNATGVYQPEAGGGLNDDGVAEVRITASNRYYVVVYASAGSAGLGSTYELDVDILPTGSLVIPNLRVASIQIPTNAPILSGQLIDYSYVVTNAGSAGTGAGPWLDRVVISLNTVLGDADDYLLGTLSHSGDLTPGATYTNGATARLPDGIAGAYYILVYVDSGDFIREGAFDGDNRTASADTFLVTRDAYPDFKIENLEVVGSNEAGSVVQVQWATANRGGRAAPTDTVTRLSLVRSGTPFLTRNYAVSALPTGGTAAASCVFTAAVAGTYQIQVAADADGQVYEYDAVSHASAEQNTAGTNISFYPFHSVAVVTNPAGAGTVTGAGRYPEGTILTLVATPVTNVLPYAFQSWTEYGTFRSASTAYTIAVLGPRTLTANFGLPMFTIAAVRAPEAGGTVNGAGVYAYGTTNVLTAYVNPGYRFTRWAENGVPVSTAASITNVVTADRTFTAEFAELNPLHWVTTATRPTNVAAVAGAGVYTNGQVAYFSAPSVVTSATRRYVFKQFLLGGIFHRATNAFERTFTTLDASNLFFEAEYLDLPLAPRLVSAAPTPAAPVPATTNCWLTLVFDRGMNPAVAPLVVLTNVPAGLGVTPPTNGVWRKTTYTNDTYDTPTMAFAPGMDGVYTLLVTRARDTYDGEMTPATGFPFEVNATPPPAPVLAVIASNAASITVGWSNYPAPADLSGFRLYWTTNGPFTSVTGLSSRAFLAAAARQTTITGVEADVVYHIGVGAVDVAGNANSAVTSLAASLSTVIPPPVTLALTAPAPTEALLNWTGYDTTMLFGFGGFRVYRELASFASVSGLTPVATLATTARTYRATDLIRTNDYWFAVVGVDRNGRLNPDVVARRWTDPYGGVVTGALVMGGSAEPDITIYEPLLVTNGGALTVRAGTTVRFAPGAGLRVAGGRLTAEGTALYPVRFTSVTDGSGMPAAGDWDGIALDLGAGGSSLRHVWLTYGRGLRLTDCAPTVTAYSARYNLGAGLALAGTSVLATADALLQYNDTGAQQAGTSRLAIQRSILNNNGTNAAALGAETLMATSVWWGVTSAPTIAASVRGPVTYSPFLTAEPLLTPAVGTFDGGTGTGSRDVVLRFACRVAEAMRVSEDSLFSGVFFTTFAPTQTFTLSEGSGWKTVYAQFRNVTGQTNPPIPLAIEYITAGPSIGALNLTEGQTLTRPYTVTAAATSPLGMQDLQLFVDGTLLAATNGGSLSYRWDVRAWSSGFHRVRLWARDRSLNLSSRELNVSVYATPPPAPAITNPPAPLVTSSSRVDLAGTAEPGIALRITRNGALMTQLVAGANGGFAAAALPLNEGDNRFAAVAYDDFGTSPSPELSVVMDTGAPEPPIVQVSDFSPALGVTLTWRVSATGERPTRFRVYWHTASFANTNEATGRGPLQTTMTYTTNLPSGTYFFGVVGYDDAGNASAVSSNVSFYCDRTAPSFTVGYDRSSPVGPGPLQVTLSASEALAATPSLVIRPAGSSSPIMLALSNTAPNTFVGVLSVSRAIPSGPATVEVGGEDLYGNRFSGAPTGAALTFDTTPPAGTVQTVPGAPVQVLSNVPVVVSLTLDETPKAGTSPQLNFRPPTGATVPVTLSGGGLSWNGILTLNPLMNTGYGAFLLSVQDEVGNTGTNLTSGRSLEIYTTALPPPPPVVPHIYATAQSGGVVRLNWTAVSNASSYKLYREPGQTPAVPTVLLVTGVTTNVYFDVAPSNGYYRYGVLGTRLGSDSPSSPFAVVYADGEPPPAPTNVTAQLYAGGIRIGWEQPAGETPYQYHIYRNGTRVHSSYTVTPWLDHPPRGTSIYVVASADWFGNEAPSAPAVFEMIVPAVDWFDVLVHEGQAPVLTWAVADPVIVGVNLYRNGVKINGAPLTTPSFTDDQFSGLARTEYSARAADALGRESPTRVAAVHRVALGLAVNTGGVDAAGAPVTRYLDRGDVSVSNQSSGADLALAGFEVRRAAGPAIVTVTNLTNIALAAGAGRIQPVIISGASNTVAQSVRVRALGDTGDGGTRVTYQRVFEVGEALVPALMVQISASNTPAAGTLGTFEARYFNRGYAPMDVVVNRGFGGAPGDLWLAIKTPAGQEVSRTLYGGGATGLTYAADGAGYVTVPPGQSVRVTFADVLVPVALAEGGTAVFEAGADAVYYQLGRPGQLRSGPISGTWSASLRETPYYATIAADRASYANSGPIHLTGQARWRADDSPATGVPVRIGFAMRNYQWSQIVTTAPSGAFTLDYTIPSGLAGVLTLWAVHPDILDRLDMLQVSVYRLYAIPQQGSIRMSKNDSLSFNIDLFNAGSETLDGFTNSFRAYRMDGTNRIDITSITGRVTFAPGFAVAGQSRQAVTLNLTAAVDAPNNAVAEFGFGSAQGATAAFTASLALSEAVPIVTVVEPAAGYVEQAVNRGDMRTRTITIANTGFRDLLGVEILGPTGHAWMVTSVPADAGGRLALPDLPVGASNTFMLTFAPPTNLPLGDYTDRLVIKGTNHPSGFTIQLYARVTSDQTGSLQFFVDNALGQPVPNATLRLRNDVLRQELTPVRTDSNGLAVVQGLMEGLWSWQVSAPGHGTKAGASEILAGQTVQATTRLSMNLVTVNFRVVPVPFTDRYEITIEQTFETHVPAPVLVVDPPTFRFQDVEPGFQAAITVRAKNHGLIALDNVTISSFQTAQATLIPLITYIPSLAPFEEIEIPYTVAYYGNAGGGSQSQRLAIQGQAEQGLIDCLSGGWLEVGQAVQTLMSLASRLGGEYYCINDPTAHLQAAAGLLIFLNFYNQISSFGGLGDLAIAAAQCLGQYIGNYLPGPSGGGYPGGPGGGYGIYECFGEGTWIRMADGAARAVETLQPGDVVRTGPRPGDVAQITELFANLSDRARRLRWLDPGGGGERELVVTDEHRLWIDGRGWTAAVNLKPGDRLIAESGERAPLRTNERLAGSHLTLSFRLREDNACYAGGILAHDLCGQPLPGAAPALPEPKAKEARHE